MGKYCTVYPWYSDALSFQNCRWNSSCKHTYALQLSFNRNNQEGLFCEVAQKHTIFKKFIVSAASYPARIRSTAKLMSRRRRGKVTGSGGIMDILRVSRTDSEARTVSVALAWRGCSAIAANAGADKSAERSSCARDQWARWMFGTENCILEIFSEW